MTEESFVFSRTTFASMFYCLWEIQSRVAHKSRNDNKSHRHCILIVRRNLISRSEFLPCFPHFPPKSPADVGASLGPSSQLPLPHLHAGFFPLHPPLQSSSPLLGRTSRPRAPPESLLPVCGAELRMLGSKTGGAATRDPYARTGEGGQLEKGGGNIRYRSKAL